MAGVPVMTAKASSADPAARLRAASEGFDTALVAARAAGGADPTEFARLRQEFSRLSDELLKRGSAAEATFALLRSADCFRVTNHWDDALPIYQRVIPLAQRAGRADYEAKAWLGIGRLENYGHHNHRAASEATDRALAILGNSPEHAILKADMLIERADLDTSAGELDQALAVVSQAVTIARSGTDRDLLFNAFYNRAGIHKQLSDDLYKVYVSLPCTTPNEWRQCQQVEREMRDHFADTLDDLTQAQAIATELGQLSFAASIQGELSIMHVLDESQQRTIAIASQMHELAVEAGVGLDPVCVRRG